MLTEQIENLDFNEKSLLEIIGVSDFRVKKISTKSKNSFFVKEAEIERGNLAYIFRDLSVFSN